MSKIDSGCAGCKRLMHSMDPKCKSCVDHCNYEYRGYGDAIKRELDMLGIKPIHRCEEPKSIYISTGGRSGGKGVLAQAMQNGYFDISIPMDRLAEERAIEYCKRDVEFMRDWFNGWLKEKNMRLPKIEKVIFNDPATIIVWTDGTKTVVKAENETFDPEKGLAMAISKKALGNEGNYYEVFKKWIPEENTKTK